MTKIIKAITIFTFCVFINQLYKQNVSAQDFLTNSHTEIININQDKSADFEVNLTLKNNDPLELIGGYNYVLPFQNIALFNVTLNGQLINYNYSNIDGGIFSNLELTFLDTPIKSGEEKSIKIKYKINEFFQKNDSSSFVKIHKTKDRIDNLAIYFPIELGDPSMVIASNYSLEVSTNNLKKINITNPKSLILIWGNSYIENIKTNFTLTNASTKSTQGIVGLISEELNQEVAYKNILGADFGLEDIFGNYYSFVKIDSKSQKIGGFEARVKKTVGEISLENLSYNLGFPENNDLLESIIDYVNRYDSKEAKIEAVNNYLQINYKPELQENLQFNSIEGEWSDLEKKDKLESFDYCFIVTAFAENLGLKSQISYGYVILPREVSVIAPHFWCYVDFGSNVIMLDPYMQALTDYDYYGLKQDFDRVTFGIWHPDQVYNDALGLLTKAKPSQKIELIGNSEFQESENTLDFGIEPEERNIYSGFPHTYKFKFLNNTSNLIPIENFYFEGKDYSDKLLFLEGLRITLLPKQENIFSIKNIRTNNFFENGLKDLSIEFKLNNELYPNFSKNITLEFKIYKNILMTLAIIIVLVIMIGIVIIKRFYSFRKTKSGKS